MTIVLASSSPRRRVLLGRLGLPFDTFPSCVDERPPGVDEPAAQYALALAYEKATDVARRVSQRPIIAADTVVAVGDMILGKPTDVGDAVRMLQILSGRQHIVVTGVAVINGGIRADVEVATVSMRRYTDAEIRAYVATGEPMDKAGAYGLQGRGGSLVADVKGCRNTVIGFPLCLVARLLIEAGTQVPSNESAICGHVEDLVL